MCSVMCHNVTRCDTYGHRSVFEHPSLHWVVFVTLLVHIESVVLQAAHTGRVGSPHLPHEPPELLPALPHPARHVLRHVDAAPTQQPSLPQHLVPVLKLLETDDDRPEQNKTLQTAD